MLRMSDNHQERWKMEKTQDTTQNKNVLRVLQNSFRALCFLAILASATLGHAQGIPVAPAATGTPHDTQFTWTASAPVTGVTVAGYNLYCSPTSGGETGVSAVNGSALIPGTSYTDTAVTAGTKQFCVVTAATAGSAQQSAFSAEVSFTTPNNPNPPTNLTIPVVALNTNGNKETLTASWQDKPGSVTGYVVWNGSKILAQGLASDPKNTGSYSISWNGKVQANVYVQVFDVKQADQPVS